MRVKVQRTTVYKFHELSDKAKEKARDWYREMEFSDIQWADGVTEDALQIAEILGIEIKTRPVGTMGGKTIQEPQLYWTLHVQGAGACYSARYSYRDNVVEELKSHAPVDETLHRIAETLADVQKRNHNRAIIDVTAKDRYMSNDYEDFSLDAEGNRNEELPEADYADLCKALTQFARWIYDQLNKQWDYANSNEAIDENLAFDSNEYEFTKEGKRA